MESELDCTQISTQTDDSEDEELQGPRTHQMADVSDLPTFSDSLFEEFSTKKPRPKVTVDMSHHPIVPSGPVPHPLDGGADALKTAQQEDPTLQAAFAQVDKPPSDFILIKDLLYRRWTRDSKPDTVDQLALP